MFRWNLLLRKVFASSLSARKATTQTATLARRKARSAKPNVKPSLEELTERIVPSASALTSPPVTDATSQMVATIEQWTPVLVTLENELSRIEQAILQNFSQNLALVQQQWAHLLGMDANTSTTSPNNDVTQAGSRSGGSNGPSNPNLTDSGSGSRSETKPRDAAETLAQPLTPSGDTDGSGTINGDLSGQFGAIGDTFNLTNGVISGGLSGSGSGSGTIMGSPPCAGPLTINGTLGDGSTFSISGGFYGTTDGNTFSGTITQFSGTSSTNDNVSGSGSFSGTLDSNGNITGGTFTISLTVTDNPATVKGQVWLDNDGDGLLDNGESGVSGVTVNLDNSSGTTLLTTTTDTNGNYQFNVTASLLNQYSNFEIQVVIPNGDAATTENVSGPDPDSNVDDNGFSYVFTLDGGENQQENAGLLITDIWTDADGNNKFSDPGNWSNKSTPTAKTAIAFDGSKNFPITYDQNANGGSTIEVRSITFQNGYKANQTIPKGVVVQTDNGINFIDNASTFNENFVDTSSQFIFAGGSCTLKNCQFTGLEGKVYVNNGASVTVGTNAGATYSTTADWNVEPSSTLNFGTTNMNAVSTFTFGAANQQARLVCDSGTINLYNLSSTSGVTFIQEGNPNWNQGNEEIDIKGGIVNYIGASKSQQVNDYLKIPIFLEGGVFNVKNGGLFANPNMDILYIYGTSTDTGASASFANTGGTINLSGGGNVGVNSVKGYNQTSGTLETGDYSLESFQTGLSYENAASISGGQITSVDAGYGNLRIGGNLALSGTAQLNLAIKGEVGQGGVGQCDYIFIATNFTLAPGNSCKFNITNVDQRILANTTWTVLDVWKSGTLNAFNANQIFEPIGTTVTQTQGNSQKDGTITVS